MKKTTDLQTFFDENPQLADIDTPLEHIFNIIKTFHVHEKLYKRMRDKKNEQK